MTRTSTFEVVTPDGARLATTLHTARGRRASRSLVLIRTPYGQAALTPQVDSWLRRGHDVVTQDVRGRGRSNGQWQPYAAERGDGAATVTALLARDLLGGGLVLAGASYDAHAALEAALAPSGAGTIDLRVVAMVPALGLHETAREPSGHPRVRDRVGWWAQHGHPGDPRPALDSDALDRCCAAARDGGLHAANPGVPEAAWHRLWSAAPLDPRRYATVRAPLLVVAGHHDYFTAESLWLADHWGGPADLLVGPWGHGLMADLDAASGAGRALRAEGGLGRLVETWLESSAAPARASGQGVADRAGDRSGDRAGDRAGDRVWVERSSGATGAFVAVDRAASRPLTLEGRQLVGRYHVDLPPCPAHRRVDVVATAEGERERLLRAVHVSPSDSDQRIDVGVLGHVLDAPDGAFRLHVTTLPDPPVLLPARPTQTLSEVTP